METTLCKIDFWNNNGDSCTTVGLIITNNPYGDPFMLVTTKLWMDRLNITINGSRPFNSPLQESDKYYFWTLAEGYHGILSNGMYEYVNSEVMNGHINYNGFDAKLIITKLFSVPRPELYTYEQMLHLFNTRQLSMAQAIVTPTAPEIIKGTFVNNVAIYLAKEGDNLNYGYKELSYTETKDSGLLFAPEVEKEDNLMVRIDRIKLRKLGWAKERDGSLNNSIGFELKPLAPMNGNTNRYPAIIKEIIDKAKVSGSCGGHINFSVSTERNSDTIKRFIPMIPLITCLYEKRLTNHYCDMSVLARYVTRNNFIPNRDSSDYSAIFDRGNRMEFRFFPAVKNLKTLQFRYELISLLNNYAECFANVNEACSSLFAPRNKKEKTFTRLLFSLLKTVDINPLIFASHVELILTKYYGIQTTEFAI